MLPRRHIPYSQEELEVIFQYDSINGTLKWRPRAQSTFRSRTSYIMWNKRFAGKPCGIYYEHNGHTMVAIRGVRYAAHRLIWALVTGSCEPEVVIGFDNGDTTDLSFGNLVEVITEIKPRDSKGRYVPQSGVCYA